MTRAEAPAPPKVSILVRRPKATLAAAIALGAAVSWGLQLSPLAMRRLERSPVVQAVLSDDASPSAGPAHGDVTIIVFTDYLCAICRGADPALDHVRAADPKIRVVYKDWPLFGARSRYASRVALAADRQGKYLAVHNGLMRTRRSLDAAAVEAVATGAGADWPRLQADLQAHGKAVDYQLARHAAEAWSLGLEGTPAYLVGPFLIQGAMSEGALRRAVSAARRTPQLG
ncbi:DsbA family protein [Phenylobacterium sp.]|uniref:DsbA family protein n=1 Tax=Phenylobacterium sp. TaxID=1871053 RepID=UPI00374D2B40